MEVVPRWGPVVGGHSAVARENAADGGAVVRFGDKEVAVALRESSLGGAERAGRRMNVGKVPQPVAVVRERCDDGHAVSCTANPKPLILERRSRQRPRNKARHQRRPVQLHLQLNCTTMALDYHNDDQRYSQQQKYEQS